MINLNVGSGTPAAGTPEKAENGSAKRGGWPKGKKRKKIPRDQTAPRQPLTGKKIKQQVVGKYTYSFGIALTYCDKLKNCILLT